MNGQILSRARECRTFTLFETHTTIYMTLLYFFVLHFLGVQSKCQISLKVLYNLRMLLLDVTLRIPARPDWRIRTGFRDARLRTGTSFFFFLKANRTDTCGYGPHLITESKTHIHLSSPIYKYKTELLHLQSERGPTCSEPFQVCWPAVCGCLLMSSPVPTRIKNPC